MKHLSLLFVILVLPMMDALGCSCKKRTVEDAFKQVTIIVHGRIIEKEIVSAIDSAAYRKYAIQAHNGYVDKRFTHYEYVRYKLAVIDKFKGYLTIDTLEVLTATHSGACGYNFEIGQEYIIYGQRHSDLENDSGTRIYPTGADIIWTNLCFRTMPYEKREAKELSQLRKKYYKQHPKKE